MSDLARRAELARRPVVIDVPVLHSSNDPYPPPGSPLHGAALVWTPTPLADIQASIKAAHRPPWWRRWWWRC